MTGEANNPNVEHWSTHETPAGRAHALITQFKELSTEVIPGDPGSPRVITDVSDYYDPELHTYEVYYDLLSTEGVPEHVVMHTECHEVLGKRIKFYVIREEELLHHTIIVDNETPCSPQDYIEDRLQVFDSNFKAGNTLLRLEAALQKRKKSEATTIEQQGEAESPSLGTEQLARLGLREFD